MTMVAHHDGVTRIYFPLLTDIQYRGRIGLRGCKVTSQELPRKQTRQQLMLFSFGCELRTKDCVVASLLHKSVNSPCLKCKHWYTVKVPLLISHPYPHTSIAEVMGLNPVGASESFLGFICNCLSYFTTVKISFTSILYPQFTHMIFIIYTSK